MSHLVFDFVTFRFADYICLSAFGGGEPGRKRPGPRNRTTNRNFQKRTKDRNVITRQIERNVQSSISTIATSL